MAAKPRKEKKPTTSVTVVTNTPPANAGSTRNDFSSNGSSVPVNAATTKLIIIAQAITMAHSPRFVLKRGSSSITMASRI